MKCLTGVSLLLALLGIPAAGAETPGVKPAWEATWAAMDAAFQQGGEAAVGDYVKANRAAVTPELLIEIATRGSKERADARLSEARLAVALAAARELGDRKAEADVLRMEGEYQSLTSQAEKALGCFEKARELYEALGDLSGQGRTLLARGKVFDQKSDRKQALALYDEALPLLEKAGDVAGQGIAYCNRGDLFRGTGDVAQAAAMYDKALPFFEKADDALGQGYVYLGRTGVALTKGDLALATAKCEEALAFFEKTGGALEQGHVWRMLGQIAAQSSEHDRALTLYEKALGYYREARSLAEQGTLCILRGDVHYVRGENLRARDMYEQALPFFQQAGQVAGQGVHYRNMGKTFWKAGQFAQALAMYDKALPLLEKAGSLDAQANLHMLRADVYLNASDYARTREMCASALPLYEKIGQAQGQGAVYMLLGTVHSREGDRAQALAMYDKAMPFFEKTGNIQGLANIYWSRGNIFVSDRDDVQAQAMYEKALPLYEKRDAALGLGGVHLALAKIAFRKGDDAKALAGFEKALEYYTKCRSLIDEANALHGIAWVRARAGRGDEALALIEQAVKKLEQVRRGTGLEGLKQSFLAGRASLYEYALALMLESGSFDAAFRTTELMKARVFLDRLAEGQVDLEKGVDPELGRQRDALESRSSALSKQRLEALAAKIGEEERARRVGKLAAELESTEKELATVKDRIRLTNPLYASVRYPETPSPAEIRQDVLRDGEALVEYTLLGSQAWCFVLTRSAFDVVKLPATPAEIATEVSALLGWAGTAGRGAPRPGDAGAPAAEDQSEGAARRLFDMLLAPVAAKAAGKQLIIVPDGALARLPFEILAAGSAPRDERLLTSYEFRYAPSAAVLAFYRARYRRDGTSDRFVGFGDPVYDHEGFAAKREERGVTATGGGPADEEARKGLERAGVVLSRLPGTGEEVRAIAALFGKGKSLETKFLRLDATEEHAKGKDLSGYGYVHFATHGILDDDYQAIALSQVPGSKEDGFLTLSEIMSLHWNARLVVLSACETGLGKVKRGEGVTGLARAVMYAGSPAAVVSLWSVSDEGTKELMTRFYGEMVGKKRSPAEALRRAKLDLAADPKWSSPYYWAPFVLYGE